MKISHDSFVHKTVDNMKSTLSLKEENEVQTKSCEAIYVKRHKFITIFAV